MIVQRVYFRVKPGYLDQFWKLANERMSNQPDAPLWRATKRTYAANIGPSGHSVCYEMEFASFTELEAGWAAWGAEPDLADFLEKWWKLVADSHSEVWDLVE
jgi:hypothetical protein